MKGWFEPQHRLQIDWIDEPSNDSIAKISVNYEYFTCQLSSLTIPLLKTWAFLTARIRCIYCCQRKWVAVGIWHVHMSETKATTHSTCLCLQNTHMVRTTPLMTSTDALYVQRMLGVKWFWDALDCPCNWLPICASISLQYIFLKLLRFLMKFSMYHSSPTEPLTHVPPVLIVCWFQPNAIVGKEVLKKWHCTCV